MDERYDVISDIAKSRSVLSMGVSCFKLVPENDNEESNDSTKRSQTELKTVKMTDMTFQVQTFNIFLLCCEEYVVDPSSLKFLVEHGFDFNKQYSKGIPYWRGSDKKVSATRWRSCNTLEFALPSSGISRFVNRESFVFIADERSQ